MDNHKAIAITGTSTGIGKACALYLDKMGFKVYAGVRKQADNDNFKKRASDRLVPMIPVPFLMAKPGFRGKIWTVSEDGIFREYINGIQKSPQKHIRSH